MKGFYESACKAVLCSFGNGRTLEKIYWPLAECVQFVLRDQDGIEIQRFSTEKDARVYEQTH